jgi:hypothetical protein
VKPDHHHERIVKALLADIELARNMLEQAESLGPAAFEQAVEAAERVETDTAVAMIMYGITAVDGLPKRRSKAE